MNDIIVQGREVLQIEADAILNLIKSLDENFVKAVDIIYNSKGRVVIAGIGKSGLVGKKIVATLNSTGTKSFFLHPVEAMHGDLGMVIPDDVFLAISNSGETEELNILMRSIQKIGCKIIAFTGNKNSTLSKISDTVIDVSVEREACPFGLAPTASTTAVLAMGDALAVALIYKKDFKSSDFKKFHPGGTIGQRLSNKVKDFMISGDLIPSVNEGTRLSDAVIELNRLKLGAVLVITKDEKLAGIITDGDIRRLVVKGDLDYDKPVEECMIKNPSTISKDAPAYDALNIMEQRQITILPIVDSDKKVMGILHLHDILGKGAFKFSGE
ncbi:MAG: KpsF/GutQ family sugar-phosphate isomerase [Desulfobacterales bacterium]|nr:KpsF/GutQ family sugar-phosphate isomerase [Desulfobacterales bacterium]